MIKKLMIFSALTFTLSTSAFSKELTQTSLWEQTKRSLNETWESSDYELYVPINVWHNRSYYSKRKIDEFNEQPWGLGLGKYRFDEDGDWHSLYAMVFTDSHYDTEPVAGYGFQKIWRPDQDFRLGAGYTVGLTLRSDFHYLPLPVIAPLLSIEYKQLALQSTYIFGGNGNGNILFTWLRWQIQ
ncbi:MAG: lipid IV(A) palmitoyltransferase PagP [Methylotenera sp.]|nr:lipid IV(A) palmitoyltransferase PagP [Methylotenera sp.]